MIVVGSANAEDAKPFFESVEPVAMVSNLYAIPRENRPMLLRIVAPHGFSERNYPRSMGLDQTGKN